MATERDTERARDQAKAQFDSIKAMVERLKHAGECDWSEPGDECDREHAEILGGLGLGAEDREPTADEYEQYHDEEAARQAIEEDPLSVEVRSGWTTPGGEFEAEDYLILLCTGGPAARIIGDLGQHNEPDRARLQYQDWGTPWEEYILTGDDADTLLEYARQFYFGG